MWPRRRGSSSPNRLTGSRWLPSAIATLASSAAWARIGGGEHFDSGTSNTTDLSGLIELLLWLVFKAPWVGIPLLLLVVGYVLYQRSKGEGSTRRALELAEAERRTATSSEHAANWLSALKSKDPQFDLLPLLDRVRRLFLELQESWFRRELEPVRRYLSDGMYQRLATQLAILDRQGVRDALAEPRVIDLQLIGLEQTPSFDTVHVRVTATLRDTDVPASTADDEARAAAQRRAPERFVEVWSFLRRPGAQSRPGDDGFGGACPACGAPFTGGAANRCEHCGAIVNSGTHDWVLAEITQGSAYAASHELADGLARARQSDPDLSTEVLEDRASLVFWRWIEAQVRGDTRALKKLVAPDFSEQLEAEFQRLAAAGRQRVFLECTLGAALTRSFSLSHERELVQVELRWSAKVGVVDRGASPQGLPTQPFRSVLVLERRAGATTRTAHGLSTCRCPTCSAPLSDNGQPDCEYCGTRLSGGEEDWVLGAMMGWEAWLGTEDRTRRPAPAAARVPDRDERERLVYLLAVVARADGTIDRRERALLRMTADRWGVPWANVELALAAGPGLGEKLLARGSAAAEAFMRELVAMARVDGRIDVNERRMLDAAAAHLGMQAYLGELLAPR